MAYSVHSRIRSYYISVIAYYSCKEVRNRHTACNAYLPFSISAGDGLPPHAALPRLFAFIPIKAEGLEASETRVRICKTEQDPNKQDSK